MDCIMLGKARLPYAGTDGPLTEKEMVLCVRCWQPVAQFWARPRDLAMEIILMLAKGNMYPPSLL